MKTIIIVFLTLLVSSAALAQVVSISPAIDTRHEDGSVTLTFSTAAIPASSKVDLAVLRIKQGLTTFAQGEIVELLNGEGKRVGISRIAPTTTKNEGKQVLKFLVTDLVRAALGKVSGSSPVTVKSTKMNSSITVSASQPDDLELIVYCTAAN